MPLAPGLPAGRECLGGEEPGSAGVGGLAPPQSDRRYNRAGRRGGEGGEDRVQGAYALEPSDLGALLGAAVDASVGGVDVHERHPVDVGLQGGGPGQAGEEVPVHRMELAVVPVGERAQEGAQGGRCSYPAEQSAYRAVPEPVGVVDRVGPGAHRRDQRHHLRARIGAGTVVGAFDA
ncbi:hypothetical protein OG823_00270 [Kitasatospora sp. NBC_00315]